MEGSSDITHKTSSSFRCLSTSAPRLLRLYLCSRKIDWFVVMGRAKIAPSMLSSDFSNLASEAERMLQCGADWLHMDIMRTYRQLFRSLWYRTIRLAGMPFMQDISAMETVGPNLKIALLENQAYPFSRHFVPNLTIGAPVIESLRKHTKAYLDCHLMVTNPLDYVEPLAKAGASGFTFHVEASKDNWKEIIHGIKAKGMRPGVALKPATPIEDVYPLVEDENPVEMVLVMTVEPGFGGQKFMPETMDKVRVLRKKFPSLDIEVDGGLGPSTIDAAASAGANCIVAGSSVFGAPEPAQVISVLRKSVEEAPQIIG